MLKLLPNIRTHLHHRYVAFGLSSYSLWRTYCFFSVQSKDLSLRPYYAYEIRECQAVYKKNDFILLGLFRVHSGCKRNQTKPTGLFIIENMLTNSLFVHILLLGCMRYSDITVEPEYTVLSSYADEPL